MVATSSLSPSSLGGDAALFPSAVGPSQVENGAEVALNNLGAGLTQRWQRPNPETHLAFIPSPALFAPVVTGAGATGTVAAAPVLLTTAAGLGLAAGVWRALPKPHKAWLKSQTLNGARQLLTKAGLPEPEVERYVRMIRTAFNQSNPVQALKALAAEWNRVATATPSHPTATTRPRTPAASSAPLPIVSVGSSTVKPLQQAIRNFDRARRTPVSADDSSARVALNHATAQAKTLLRGQQQLPTTISNNLKAFIQQATERLYPSSVAVPARGSMGGSKAPLTIPDTVREAVQNYIAQNSIPKSESGQQDPLEEILRSIEAATTPEALMQALEALAKLLGPEAYAQLLKDTNFTRCLENKLSHMQDVGSSVINKFLIQANHIVIYLQQLREASFALAQNPGLRAKMESLLSAAIQQDQQKNGDKSVLARYSIYDVMYRLLVSHQVSENGVLDMRGDRVRNMRGQYVAVDQVLQDLINNTLKSGTYLPLPLRLLGLTRPQTGQGGGFTQSIQFI